MLASRHATIFTANAIGSPFPPISYLYLAIATLKQVVIVDLPCSKLFEALLAMWISR
jgi:hypothetical protein